MGPMSKRVFDRCRHAVGHGELAERDEHTPDYLRWASERERLVQEIPALPLEMNAPLPFFANGHNAPFARRPCGPAQQAELSLAGFRNGECDFSFRPMPAAISPHPRLPGRTKGGRFACRGAVLSFAARRRVSTDRTSRRP
jgi:hypothetical protein